jgi:hypothetical protein
MMKRSALCGFLFVAVAGLFWAESAIATTLKRMSIEEMSRAATVVVRAQCTTTAPAWDEGEIWTFSSFQIKEVWKGSASGTLTVRLLGGTMGNLVSSVSGVPRFHPGEDVVLFLQPTRRGDFSVVSWVQGTFRVSHDRRTGQDWALQDAADFHDFDPGARQFAATATGPISLAALRSMVLAAARQGRRIQ